MISVVMPVFNGAATIRAAIESVLRQTYADLELVVIDDGSTDTTPAILTSCKDERVRVYTQDNGGVSATRNRAIRLARGTHIAFLDADDLWAPDKLDAQLRALNESPKAAAAYCWVNTIDANGKFLFADSRPTFRGDVYRHMLAHNFIHSGSNLLIKSEALESVGLFDPSLSGFEDWDLQLRVAAHFPFTYVPRVLAFYRTRTGSLTTRVLSMERDYHRVADRTFTTLPSELAALRPRNEAVTYEYLMSKAVQGFPTRRKALLGLAFFYRAVRASPAILWWPRPKLWVWKRVLIALIWIARSQRWVCGYLESTNPPEE